MVSSKTKKKFFYHIFRYTLSRQERGHMKESKQQLRLKNIIHYIEKHQGCSTFDLAKRISKINRKVITERTIQEDLKYLRIYWKDGQLTSSKGFHQVKLFKKISQKAIEEEKKIFLKLSLESLENLSDLSKHSTTLTEELNLNTLSTPYYIKSETYQKLKTYQEHDDDIDDIKNLAEAIKKDFIIEFKFSDKRYHVEPYRLVNFDGIWYLYGKDKEEETDKNHKTWMLKDIDEVEVYYGDKHNTSDKEIDEDLEEAHSAHFIPDKVIEVKLKVAAKVADLFRQKNHLPNQNSTIQDDGSLLVISTISTYADIDPEVKSWLPHIEILEPKEYRDSFKEELIAYIKGDCS